jgi:transcription initiation factor TFIIE subunit alpha
MKKKKEESETTRIKKLRYSKRFRLTILSSAKIRQKLIEMGGENTIDVIREFDKDMSDEELAKKIGVRASDVRIVLNRLHSCGLFAYTRLKDKNSGWYTYIWKLNEEKLQEFSEEFSEDTQEKLEGERVENIDEEDYIKKNYLGLNRKEKY